MGLLHAAEQRGSRVGSARFAGRGAHASHGGLWPSAACHDAPCSAVCAHNVRARRPLPAPAPHYLPLGGLARLPRRACEASPTHCPQLVIDSYVTPTTNEGAGPASVASRGRAPETRATALAEKRYDDGKLLLVRVADGATLSERLNVGIAAAAEQRRPYVALLGRDASFSRWVASPPPPTQTPTHPPTHDHLRAARARLRYILGH